MPKFKPLWPRLALLMLLTPILASCGAMMASSVTSLPVAAPAPAQTACTVFGPIHWAAADTDETIREAKAHNAAWKALCAKP